MKTKGFKAADIKKKTSMSVEAIGFTTEYFTLWNVTEEKHSVELGGNIYNEYSTMHYLYVKNISKDVSKVKALYPNITIDYELKGSQSFTHEQLHVLPDEYYKYFSFGKYYGKKIEDCTDIKYLIWFYDNCNEKSQEYVLAVLRKYGYALNKYGCIELISEIESDKLVEVATERFKSLFNTEHEFDCFVEQNPREDGDIFLNGAWFKFSEVAERSYNDHYYYLPVVQGKAKIIKHRNVHFTAVKQSGDEFIKIINFQVIK